MGIRRFVSFWAVFGFDFSKFLSLKFFVFDLLFIIIILKLI